VAESPAGFAGLLRGLRREAGLTQEGLAGAAGLSVRAISYLERGAVGSPQRDTVRLLADALGLVGPVRAGFEAAARGRAAAGGVAAATRTLPRDVASFTGRQEELERLAQAAAGAGGVVAIHAIGGMAGVGKTAFAVHAAHRLAGRFPGGQIFLPLHGHTPGQEPVDPEDALASLLLTAGVAPAQIPPGLEARMGLWRDRLAGRQLLLILDDAAGSEQVLPLLPGAGGSLVLVTSRRHLSGLEGATAVSLDTLPPGQAAALLVRLAGRAWLSPDHPGVEQITGLCGYLPLAIGMVARQLHHHPAWSVAGRAAELAAAAGRLELMATENLSVAAAFDLSYADLAAGQQRLFRRLGLHPGAEFDGYAAAALDGTDPGAARRGLEALYDQYLLSEPAAGRYRMHDLIREHARALAGRADPDDDRDAATARLLDYYQHAAARADALISHQTRPVQAVAADRPAPAAVPVLAGREEALAWARAERASLTACLDQATAAGQHARIIGLTAGLAGLLRHDGPWAEAITRHEAANRVAGHLGDRLGQAGALNDLGAVRRMTGDYPAAAQALEQALGIYRDLDDRLGEAEALNGRGTLHRVRGELAQAEGCHQQALQLSRAIASAWDEAHALAGLGRCALAAGHAAQAEVLLRQALEIFQRTGAAEADDVSRELTVLTGAAPPA
jgi:transcriptional regulator with XRE-family HTH domain/tetratricopeptide (TPR) repeat protein